MLPSTPLRPSARAARSARPLWLVRAGLLAVLGFLGPLLWLPPLGTAPGPGAAAVWADDGGGDSGGDSGGDDGGGADGDSGADAGGSAADGGGSGADPAPAWGWFAAAQRADEHLPNELLALNPSSAALAYARLQTGVEVLETRNLRGLGLQVVRLRLHGVPARATLERLRAFDLGTFHLQHLYALAQTPAAAATAGEPRSEPISSSKQAIGWPASSAACGRRQVLGIVDTEVQLSHPALRGAQIRSQRQLSPEQTAVADDHGTAIAALLVGQPAGGYTGLMPRARLLAAAPFYRLPSGQTRADALGLALSLDWLVGQGAQVIGMSLAGPRNAVLDAALERARARGVVVVAAAGNGGRAAAPAFPAAHPAALAVTALTPAQAVYRRASQGEHIRFALPGADLPTLGRDGALQRRSGTSFAVPFLVALVSQSLHERQLSAAQWFSGQGMALQDLGAPGRDPVFGWGLPRVTPRCG